MPNKVISHFYKEIKFLAAAIGTIGVPEKLFEAAREQDVEKYKLIREQIKNENPKLQERLCRLYGDYVWECCPTIFLDKEDYSEEDKQLFSYNSKEINPVNLITLMVLSNRAMEETCMFMNPMELQEAFSKQGKNEISRYMKDFKIESFYDLMDMFLETKN